ncbi:MAG: hypothetical protein HYW05_01510 [Candidatus Diapherotrites archaeon]|nr:hypothetical protein [Candidatus Diapherotrites archaeon]
MSYEKNIPTGDPSFFIHITESPTKRGIIYGPRDGSGEHGHITFICDLVSDWCPYLEPRSTPKVAASISGTYVTISGVSFIVSGCHCLSSSSSEENETNKIIAIY